MLSLFSLRTPPPPKRQTQVREKERVAAAALATALEKEAQGNSLWLAREQMFLDAVAGKSGKGGKDDDGEGGGSGGVDPAEARREALREAKRMQARA